MKKISVLIPCLVVVIVSIFSCGEEPEITDAPLPDEPDSTTISGVIIDYKTREPLEGVDIFLHSGSLIQADTLFLGRTDSKGRFKFVCRLRAFYFGPEVTWPSSNSIYTEYGGYISGRIAGKDDDNFTLELKKYSCIKTTITNSTPYNSNDSITFWLGTPDGYVIFEWEHRTFSGMVTLKGMEIDTVLYRLAVPDYASGIVWDVKKNGASVISTAPVTTHYGDTVEYSIKY